MMPKAAGVALLFYLKMENASLNEIHKFLKAEGVSHYKYPDQLEILDIWPLTNIGKIDKKSLVKMAMRLEQELKKQ